MKPTVSYLSDVRLTVDVTDLCAAGSLAGDLMCVRGQQNLEIQGHRLNMTKEEKTSVTYGPDRRLDPIITPPMPLLEVCLSKSNFDFKL